MDCTATTIAASKRIIIIPGLDMSLPTLNESEQTLTARLKSRKVKTFSSFNSDLNGFSHQSIFSITQLKNAIGIDGEIQTVKQLTDRLATMARLSNDAKSGLKELFAPISRLAVAEQEAIWTPSFLTKSIQTIRDQLQAFTAVLPATFPIILAENGSHSIQFGHYSLILLYSRLLEQVEEDLPRLRDIFESNDEQRKTIFAIINWTIGRQNSILTWSQSISEARYKKIGFH